MAPTPLITLTGSLTPFSNIVGTPTASQPYQVAGSNLTADILITPPANFEIRTGVAAFSNSPITLTQAPAGTVSTTTIDVRYNPLVAGSTSGNITHISSGAVTQNEAVSGSSLELLPTVQGTVSISGIGVHSMKITIHSCGKRSICRGIINCRALFYNYDSSGTITTGKSKFH